MDTFVPYYRPQSPRSSRRPATIAELASHALENHWDEKQEFKHHLRMAEKYRREGKAYAEKGDLENAFVYYARAASLVLEKMPTHRDYYNMLNPAQRKSLGLLIQVGMFSVLTRNALQNGQDLLEVLAELKPILVQRYDMWLAHHPDESESARTLESRKSGIPEDYREGGGPSQERMERVKREFGEQQIIENQAPERRQDREEMFRQEEVARQRKSKSAVREPDYFDRGTEIDTSLPRISTQELLYGPATVSNNQYEDRALQNLILQEEMRKQEEEMLKRWENKHRKEADGVARRQREAEDVDRAIRDPASRVPITNGNSRATRSATSTPASAAFASESDPPQALSNLKEFSTWGELNERQGNSISGWGSAASRNGWGEVQSTSSISGWDSAASQNEWGKVQPTASISGWDSAASRNGWGGVQSASSTSGWDSAASRNGWGGVQPTTSISGWDSAASRNGWGGVQSASSTSGWGSAASRNGWGGVPSASSSSPASVMPLPQRSGAANAFDDRGITSRTSFRSTSSGETLGSSVPPSAIRSSGWYTYPKATSASSASPPSTSHSPHWSDSAISIYPELNLDSLVISEEDVDAAMSPFTSLCEWFIAVLADQSKYRILLSFRNETAQKILDTIQMLLDDPRLEHPHLRKGLLSALVRLSKNSVLYPKCYTLKGIQRESEAVASGHFGEIWKGEFEGRKVCLKMVKVFQKSQVERLLKAFCKEAIVWKHLSHPNVLPFYGIYHLEDLHNRVCLVSPWMENGNVIEFLKWNSNVVHLLLISDILEGISYLHDENIVHGDIKGVNIVVTESGRACLADFGLSSVIDSDILRWTSVATTVHASGTVRWQAQELFVSDDDEIMPTKASDIYSFSCTCYEIFTGRMPYHEIARDPQVILKVMQGGRPSRPSSAMEISLCHERGMTGIMWELMEACWHPVPAMRPTAKQALSRLPFVAKEDVQKDSNMLSSLEFRSTTHIPVHISADEAAEIISLVGRFVLQQLYKLIVDLVHGNADITNANV